MTGELRQHRCPLCGTATNGAYCHAHAWAAGPPHPAKPPRKNPSVSAATIPTMTHDRRTYADGWNARGDYETSRRQA